MRMTSCRVCVCVCVGSCNRLPQTTHTHTVQTCGPLGAPLSICWLTAGAATDGKTAVSSVKIIDSCLRMVASEEMHYYCCAETTVNEFRNQ